MSDSHSCVDGNEAAAHVAYHASEVCAIYPITPSSTMGELCDDWASEGRPNLWGDVPRVIELQSEGGAAGSLHGALQAGCLATTFTASQGLLLMIPNMYKIAGELTPCVIHVTARSLATQALSIFGDHSDVMATRMTGFAMLCASSVQEAADFALISHAATLRSRLPFLHFFDGFRTSHEINTVVLPSKEQMLAMLDGELLTAMRARALTPDRPTLRGTAQNPDVFFQARETVNPFVEACPVIVQQLMDQWAGLSGRSYRLMEYYGHAEAERIVLLMGSGLGTVQDAVDHLLGQGEKVGVVAVRLYRPFSADHLLAALPVSARRLAVLDRTKEPGAAGEPLYQDVVTALNEHWMERLPAMPLVVGGRYGLSSKEFTPAMVAAVFANLAEEKPRNHFTIGIHDDVSHKSLDWQADFRIEDEHSFRALFFGLGSDGTVGANKNTIKIIGSQPGFHAQGYFVYDSKKSGSTTVSHLRFGPKAIRASYLIQGAHFVACHARPLLNRMDVLEEAMPGATFLLNSARSPQEVWSVLPARVIRQIREKRLKFFVIDANQVARASGLGGRINTIMQTCFFAISGVLPADRATALIKQFVEKTYSAKGPEVVKRNFQAIDAALAALHPVPLPAEGVLLPNGGTEAAADPLPTDAPAFVRSFTSRLMEGKGDDLPVSALPCDGVYPIGTARYEKRGISSTIPAWEENLCIQCNKCVLVCPHSAIRAKVFSESDDLPAAFTRTRYKARNLGADLAYVIQVAPEDCTGCTLCVEICPARDRQNPEVKALAMVQREPILEREKQNWQTFLNLPDPDRSTLNASNLKESQFLRPLFEFSGACAGCGETPYLKLLSQLFGDRALIANATGCSSIYGGNLPTTPWTCNEEGRGPAWSNSLFEDNAEFGLGFRVALDQHDAAARRLLQQYAATLGPELAEEMIAADQRDEAGVYEQRQRLQALAARLAQARQQQPQNPDLARLQELSPYLVRKSVWIVGGDGWAYDIGFGGLDHVLASGADVNVLVLDTEVYSNTGGQMSKSTPLGSVARFAAGGKQTPKKDLGLMAMSYGHVYVARIAMGASDTHTLKAFIEAEAYRGPSLLIAYSHCIAHGYDMAHGLEQQKAASESGHWPLYRFHPERTEQGSPGLQLDSKPPSRPLAEYIYREGRYRSLQQADPETAARLLAQAESELARRMQLYATLAGKTSIS
jgi:pyruvate-ferredoxin/flavodoxin oxidoreductase